MKYLKGVAIALLLLVSHAHQALAQADLCANAGVVTCGTSLTGQTNVGATNDAFPACNTNGTLATGAPNVWYTFVGTGQTVTVSTCANTSFDSEIGVFSGSCGSLVCVAGNDSDACGTSDETVTFNSVAGTNYFIMVQGHSSGTGTFTLDVTCAAPPADPCAAPIETIACASSKSVTLSGGGAGWSVNACGFTTPGAEKVYSFTPTVTGTHTLQVTATNNTFIDYFFKAASGGCSSSGWTCIDDIASATSVTFGPLTAGTTYLILLDDENTSASTQTFQINCPAPPVDPCAAPIETIACASSKTVTLNGSGAGWNVTACGFATLGAEKVYSFTPTVTGTHTLQVTAGDNTFIDYFFKDASGGCSATGWTCIDDISLPGSFSFGPLTAGTTYLILLDDESTTSSTHTFQINCPNPPVVLTCPTNTTVAACQTQAAVNAAFATWLATASGTGGCSGVLTNNNTGAPSACGGSTTVTFTYTSTCAPLTTTCQATFTVAAPPTIILTCPTNTTAAACQTQAAVNAAFATWLATATASGGCNGVLTNNNTGAPPACGGSTTVTFTYTSSCAPLTTTCQATFTVAAPPTVILTCPTNTTSPIGQTQAAVNAAFATWLATATASGGCNGVLTNNNIGAPPATGGSTTVNFTYTSSCAPLTTTCQATFTVSSAPPVILTCPNNTTVAACQTQAAVNAAFATWLASATASGGCNGVLTNNNTGAPPACGGSTTVTFTYTSTCAPLTTTCQATFTVAVPPTTVLTCPINTTVAACQTQAAVNAQFSAWLASATASGGCNGVLTNNNTGAPAACGGSTTVTFTYTSTCAPTTTTCQATFTVVAAPAPLLTCPTPTTASACLTQVQLDAAYAAWLATASASGGCNGVITNNGGAAPAICSATAVTKTVTFTYTSSCAPTTTTCTSTFTVPAYPTFALPANGAATVACPVNATQPTPPTAVDGCGKTLAPSGPVITNNPATITCEGTRTYAWTYTDCAGLARTWSFVYTIERQPFTVPANGSATVACPANATQPVPPVVLSNCGETLTPTGPVVTNNPASITCEGTRTYAWTYTDCEGNTATWSFVYTIERQPFSISPAFAEITVDCPDDTDVVPTPPVVTSNCGEVLTPVVTATPKPSCEGDRAYYFTYTDCEGNTATWQFIYRLEYLDFVVPANTTETVECPLNVVVPTPPTVQDNCGNTIVPVGPTVTSNTGNGGCEASRTYSWTYKDCEENLRTWSKTFSFAYTVEAIVPESETIELGCILFAQQPPFPPVLFDNCGQQLVASGPTVEGQDDGCSGWRKFTFTYTDCGGNTYPWSTTYVANDQEPPTGSCPDVDETDLSCIGDVPCPEDFDFSAKTQELLDAGGFYDLCSGTNLTVKLVTWTEPWDCSDADGDGNFTFGRTFYFSVADACGNEIPSLCAVTYAGNCQPIETFLQSGWGIPGGEPSEVVGNGTTDLSIITDLLALSPVVMGGTNRSLTVTDAACAVNLMPGTSAPSILSNCHQTNCMGCNPMGVGGLKNSLAANLLALELNLRYNVKYNGLTLDNLLDQDLGCVSGSFDPTILNCPPSEDECVLRIVENNGTVHEFPNNIEGLLDMVNLYLNGGLVLTFGQSSSYANALNKAVQNVNTYWHERSNQAVACGGAVDSASAPGQAPSATGNPQTGAARFDVVPNPASGQAVLRLAELQAPQEVVAEVYNQFGQLVLRKDFGEVSYLNEEIDLVGLSSGLYIVNVKAGGQRFEQKLVVEK